LKLFDPDDGGAKEAVDPAFASGAAVADSDGTIAKAFEENESEREPSKSISTLLAVAGAAGPAGAAEDAEKKYKDIMSTRPTKWYFSKTINYCCLNILLRK